MPRIPVHTVDSAPEESREALAGLEKAMGTVLNIHGEMAESPAVIHGYAGLQEAIATHGTYDGRAREVVVLAALARTYVDGVGEVPDHLWQRGRDAGWSDQQLAELTVHVTVNQLTNHFNHYVGTELDLPAAPEV